MKLKLPHSTQNWISVIGAMIALITLFMIVFLFVITGILEEQGSYMGLIVYILLPAVMIVGMLLIPVGMIVTNRKIKQGKSEKADEEWPKLDLNNIRHRNAFMIFSIGTTIFLFLSAVGSYEAFHFTESVTFCGEICHTVMEPEFVAYQSSPHARVACVDCHVGSGANWYMRSKLSGLYQVYAVLANVYPQPIPTPVKNLRPARETCEKCHWPEKFYAQTLRVERHYLNDEENTPWDIYLNIKIGGEYSAHGLAEGIHWHINPDVQVEYYPGDEQNLSIPWVRYTDKKTGEVIIYNNQEDPIDPQDIDQSKIRTMDCMDCHNRPSHSYKPPALFVNDAITAEEIPLELPEIKSLAMEICGEEFTTRDSALNYIRESIVEFYQDGYPEIYDESPELVEKAITGLQNAFSENIFPYMKVRWDVYPNHIGHLEFDGCFRCHNDQHVSDAGDTIEKDCNQCHSIIAQGSTDEMEYASIGSALEFRHPVDIDGAWQEGFCTDCHTGLNP